jgi:hypothetical protein
MPLNANYNWSQLASGMMSNRIEDSAIPAALLFAK